MDENKEINEIDPLVESSADEEKSKGKFLSEFLDWMETLIIVPVAVVLIFTFVLRTSVVDGESMLNTLHPGDMLIISNTFYTPSQGDIIVVTTPGYSEGKNPLVKRIIATQGQSVDINFDTGIVFVDGVALDEPYTYTPTNVSYDMTFPITIKPGHVFAMGDNRNGSYDSRAISIGQIDERMIMGKAYTKIFPLSDFQMLD